MRAKHLVLAAAALLLLAATAEAAKITYITTNHRFNYVKLKEIKASEAESRHMTHPVNVDEVGLRTALASINLARSYIIKKEVDTQQVFDENALDFLSPALARAFAQAQPNEVVVFSYLSKQPMFILRNDRLNLGRAWISGSELHVKFEKLYAKVTGDIDRRGNEAEAIARAQGLRVKLELGPGQKLGLTDTDEVVLDINYNYAENLRKPEPSKVDKTMAGKEFPKPEGATTTDTTAPQEVKSKKLSKKEKARIEAEAKEHAAEDAQAAAAAAAAPSPKDRLQALDQLKKDGLVTKQEYDLKRKEILKDL
ncbi:MAG: hypothetical protein WC956_07790 [bacterium]